MDSIVRRENILDDVLYSNFEFYGEMGKKQVLNYTAFNTKKAR